MARIQFYDTISSVDPDGTMRALTGITVTVYNHGAATKPNIYALENDVVPIAGSSFDTVDGVVDFWVDVGAYDLVFEDTQVPSRIQAGLTISWQALPASANSMPGSVLATASLAEDKLAQLVGSSFTAALLQRLYAPGDMKASYQPADHAGWLLCDGRNNLVVATYPQLGALMQAQGFAGIDGGHFAVPDYQGRALVGKGTHADVNALNKNDGIVSVGSRKVKHQHSKTLAVANGSTGISIPQGGSHIHELYLNNGVGGGGGPHAINTNNPGEVWVNTGESPSYFGVHGHSVTDPGHGHSLTGAIGDTGGPTDLIPFQIANLFIKT